eukprot:scaffold23632_cov169-Skeletonema_dohrnii-CCMP3373.AAC.2
MASKDLKIEEDICCALCGIAEVDNIKLKECTDCDLVRYCSDKCLQEHRSEHEAICIERMAELRDEILFRQPESSHYGDCPICFLPHSIDRIEFKLMSCCCQAVCVGCAYTNQMREKEENLHSTCPFCRHPVPKSEEEFEMILMKRVAVNDPFALRQMGSFIYTRGDYDTAFEYFTRASEL